jgi:ring-1,2-phenylacetyl-CoA epoxidase subunit PaaD
VVVAAESREAIVWAALAQIGDPEIPTIGLVDLGVIGSVRFASLPAGGDQVRIELLPTFVGCPAIEVMRDRIGDRMRELQVADEVVVELSYRVPWTSERITPAGREALRRAGYAPPAAPSHAFDTSDLLTMLPVATCPYCGSRNTTLENPFGPALCRAIYHCASCRQPFEAFKSV